jgi:PAS domain S-box-containing protein
VNHTELATELFGKSDLLTEGAKNFLAAVIASSDDAIISKDLNGVISSWNEGARRIFGYEADEIVGQPILRLIPAELHHEEDFILAKIRAGERVEPFETTRLRKSGQRFPVSVTISPVRDDSGAVIGASKIARDISDRRRMDQSRYRLAAIVDSSDDAIISKDLNGIINSWNEGARRIFGYDADEIIGQSILRLIPPELHHEEDFIMAKIRAGERVEHFETTRLKKGGERLPISVTISPIKDDNGAVIGASKIGRDVSDRRRLDESRARLAAIVDSADDAIIGKNLDGIITSWNNGARHLFGYEADEIIGQSVLRLFPDHLKDEEGEILRKLRAGEKIEHYETTRVSKSGQLREVALTISPVRNSQGLVIGASKIARDISDRKKVEHMAIEAEKIATTGRMAAAIAHEINNPLASVLNLIYLARQSDVPKEEIQNLLATAEREMERVSHIARQTLGYYRDTGAPSLIHLRDLVENILSVYRTKLERHHISVETKYHELRKVRVHSGEIIQVFSNVISNAVDAMPKGGKLSISVNHRQDRGMGLEIIVSDTGHGIHRDHLPRVFEPFYTTKGNLGTGIGLWVARQLVERHDGQISISSSTQQGESGTIVTVFLPYEAKEQMGKPNGAQARSDAQ